MKVVQPLKESVAMAVAMQSEQVSKSLEHKASLEVRRETDRRPH